MFRQLANGLASGVLGEGPIKNAALEAFLLHARALTEFFYQSSPRSDDIVAQDFMPAPVTWAVVCPPITSCDVRHWPRIRGEFNPAVNQAECRNVV